MEVMAMKGYPTLTRSPELEPHHYMQFSVLPRTGLTSLQVIQSENSKSQREDIAKKEKHILSKFFAIDKMSLKMS